MSFQIESVTLPRWPSRITFKLQADVKETRFPGALPLLIAFGRKANKLQIEGVIQEPAHTKANLVTDYLSPLDNLIYTTVTITATGMLYHNRDMVFAGATFEERPGVTRAFFYNMEFWQGSQVITL